MNRAPCTTAAFAAVSRDFAAVAGIGLVFFLATVGRFRRAVSAIQA